MAAGGPFHSVDHERRAQRACPKGSRHMALESPDPTRPVEVVLVEAPACHLCEDAARTLDELAREVPLSVRRVDIASAEGRAIVRHHRAPMPPVVIVDGELLGWGRLSRGKLQRRLDELTASGARR